MKISKELKTGILVTITIGLGIWGFNLLKGRNLFSNEIELYSVYSNVNGLMGSNPVLLNGYQIGMVRDVYLHPDHSGKLVVKFVITETDFPIQDSASAEIISSDILGSKAINIVMRKGARNVVNGDTLAGTIEKGLGEQVNEQILPLKKKAEGLISSIDSIMLIVQAILNQDARASLTSSFESIKKALATFEKTAIKIDDMVESERSKLSMILSKVENITSTISKNDDQITKAMNNLSNISDSIAKSNLIGTINNTNKTLEETSKLLEKVNKGEGSLGMLLHDKKLYNDLDSASVSLNRLLEDMQKHPGDYFSVFGKKRKAKKKKN
ncbi:MAG: MCE family protein [Bacteroidia bacterium]|nr:MCE family protein [Bacteroidia bacterium]